MKENILWIPKCTIGASHEKKKVSYNCKKRLMNGLLKPIIIILFRNFDAVQTT